MADVPGGLAAAERWLQSAVLAPEPPESSGAVTEVLTASERLSAAQRLDVYRRGYRARLLEAMRSLHPALCALLGRELFDDFALAYLEDHPSRSYTLFELNRGFAGHLAAHRPDRELPEASREPWIDIVIDVARYEREFAEVYDGPGTEELQPAPPVQVGPAFAADELPYGPVQLAPCLRLLTLCAPVHRYVAAVRRGQDTGRRPAPPSPRPVRLALSRRDYTVTTTELAPDAHHFLAALAEGAPAPEAAGRAGLAASDAVRLLRGWAADGWVLTRLRFPNRSEETA